MANETTKSRLRRLPDTQYAQAYFVGVGIDIGCGDDSLGQHTDTYPNIESVRPWDLPDGDAQLMSGVADNTYDFVHSSHCLEHMRDPHVAMANWIRICKSGGYIVVTIPEEDLYEQGNWPSNYNHDHKTTWTIAKENSWSPVSVSVLPFLYGMVSQVEIIKIQLIDHNYHYDVKGVDQTRGEAESAIEFIIRKR
jgi:ubiquinone/menaquinone biosynthesis C-methylase UbiE